jgi:hypothetical protein
MELVVLWQRSCAIVSRHVEGSRRPQQNLRELPGKTRRLDDTKDVERPSQLDVSVEPVQVQQDLRRRTASA